MPLRLLHVALDLAIYGVRVSFLVDNDARFTSGPSLGGLKTLGVA